MFMAAFENLPGIGSILVGVAGLTTAYITIRKSKQEGSKQCHELLNASRKEAEEYAIALHKVRMAHPELDISLKSHDYGQEGLAALWMVASIGLFCTATALGMMSLGVVGDRGPPGPAGPPGPPGIQGIQGPPGPAGPAGLQGPTETTIIVTPGTGTSTQPGESGVPGAAGGTGSTGPSGTTGSTGATGETGSVGPQGEQGPPGPIGQTGPQGPPGIQCPPGFIAEELTINTPGGQTTLFTCVAQ